MVKAIEEGNRFLAGNFNASAMQLLGAKVMVGLAGGAAVGSTFESPEDQVSYRQIAQERDAIVKRQAELAGIIRDNDAVINSLTLNRRRAVQQGTANYFTCAGTANAVPCAEG